MTDEEHRQDCFNRFKNAVKALQAGDKQTVVAYLRYLEAKHGREFAEGQRDVIRRCAKHKDWQ